MLFAKTNTETKTVDKDEVEKKANEEKKQKEAQVPFCVLNSNFAGFQLCCVLLAAISDPSSRHSSDCALWRTFDCMLQKAAIIKKAKHSVAGIYANLAKNLSDEPPKPEQFTLLQHRLAPVDR